MSVVPSVNENENFLNIKWDPPVDLGGGEITKFEIRMSMMSLESNQQYKPWSKELDARKLLRSTVIIVPAYTRITVWIREGGGDSPVWGNYSLPIMISTPEAGAK